MKHHTDIINFTCMTWNFVRILASLSALCKNQICRCYVFMDPQTASLCTVCVLCAPVLDELEQHLHVGDHEAGDLWAEADHGPQPAVLRDHAPLLAHDRVPAPIRGQYSGCGPITIFRASNEHSRSWKLCNHRLV